eukprot:Tbor_TRINITY_DN7542_c0_g1::TRINITY_DN7542_c0_g1_i1::g.885::m.885
METANIVVCPSSDHSIVEPLFSTLDTSSPNETSVCCFVINPGDSHNTGLSSSPSPRSGHYMEYSPFLKKVVLYGGLGFSMDNEYFNDLWVVDPTTDQWERLCDPTSEVAERAPVGTFGHAACLFDEGKKMFIHGGINWVGATCEAWIYDFETSEWIEFIDEDGPLHDYKRWGHSATLMKNPIAGEERIVLFGGDIDCRDGGVSTEYDGISSDHLLVISTRPWHTKLISQSSSQGWPKGRRRHGAVVYRDVFLLIFGGRDLNDIFYDDLWVLNTLTFMWIQIGPSLPPRLLSFFYDNPSVSQYGDMIRKLTLEGKGTKEEQHRDGISESTLPRTGLSLLCASDILYITGGFYCLEKLSYHNFTGFACYSIIENRWFIPEHVGIYPNSVTMSAACLIPGIRSEDAVECYLHGGRSKDTPVNSFYAVKLKPAGRIRLKEVCTRWFFSNERRYNLEHVNRRDKIVEDFGQTTPHTIRTLLRSEALLKYTNGSR